ncbi:MAG: hypothetical protein ACLTNY_10085, partial [Blautia massiliensis (ex Durand et al. 2017)]
NPKGETGASGIAVRDCCPFWSLSSFTTSSVPPQEGHFLLRARIFWIVSARPCQVADFGKMYRNGRKDAEILHEKT